MIRRPRIDHGVLFAVSATHMVGKKPYSAQMQPHVSHLCTAPDIVVKGSKGKCSPSGAAADEEAASVLGDLACKYMFQRCNLKPLDTQATQQGTALSGID